MAPVAERTYSFRAPGDLAERISEAGVVLDQLEESVGPVVAERIAAELVLALVRNTSRLKGAGGNQSAFVRETVELIVGAVEKVAADLGQVEAYAQEASARNRDELEFRQAARARAAQRWHDA
jgi:hypothetical protein